MKDLIRETIEKIKVERIIPEPRWKYLVKKYGMWVVFGGIVLLGAISFAVAFDLLSQLDWDLYRFVHQSVLLYSLSLLPYFWLVMIALLLALAFFDLRKTETGYRFGWFKMACVSIGAIITFGFIFSLFGIGGKFNAFLVKDIPYYGQHMMMTKEKQWSNPSGGFLSGTITSGSNNKDNLIKITDLKGNSWDIITSAQTLVRPMANTTKGSMIKIIGQKISENSFQALEIRPWMGQGMMNGSGPARSNVMMNGGANRRMMNGN